MGLLLQLVLLAAVWSSPEEDLRLSATDQYNQSMAWHSSLPGGPKAASMEDSGRLAELSLSEVLAALALKPGMSVLDLGAGSGYYSVGLARAVGPGGLVYAADTDPAMLELVRSRALAEGLENLQPLAVPRAPSSTNPYAVIQVDRVLLNSVVDVVPSPRELFVQVAALLKPGGRVVVVYPRLYPDFSPTADLPCAKARDWVRQLPSGSPFEAAFRDAGLPSNGNSACPTGGFARALNSLLADQAFFPRFAALTRALGGGPNALLELNSTEEARGVFRAAFLQHQLASGKPRAGTLRVLTWSALVGTFGLESQSWGYALGRGIYLPREALVKLAQGAGLRLEGSLDQVPRYLVLVFGKPEASQ